MPCDNADTAAALLSQADAEAAVLCLINEQRQAEGADPLAADPQLRVAAEGHAMAANALKWWAGGGSNVHTNPETGSTPETRIHDAGYCVGGDPPLVAENCYEAWYIGGLAFANNTTPQAAVDWWMGSPSHRATLLSPAYLEVGVAVILGTAEPIPGAEGAIFVTDFATCDPAVHEGLQGAAGGG